MEITLTGASAVFAIVGTLLAAFGVAVSIGIWIGKVNTDRASFKNFMSEIKTEMKEVQAKLNRILGGLSHPVTTKESPVVLTEEGSDLSDCIDAKTVVDELATDLFPRINGMDKYQVQEFCEDYFIDQHNPGDDVESKWRECAYQKGLKMHHVHLVLAVELRDKLLSMRGRPRT